MRHILFASLLYCTNVLSSRQGEFRGLRQCFFSVHYCRFGNDVSAIPCTKQQVTTDDQLIQHPNLTVLDTTAFCASNLPQRVQVSNEATSLPLALANDNRSIVVMCPRTLERAECWLAVHNHVLSPSVLPRAFISLSGGGKRSRLPRMNCRVEWKKGAVKVRSSWFIRGESTFYRFPGNIRKSPLEVYVNIYPFESKTEEKFDCGVRVLVSKLLSVSVSSTYKLVVHYKPIVPAPSTRPSQPVTPTKPEVVKNETLWQFCGDKKPLASEMCAPSRSTASPSPIETTGISQTIVPKGSEEKRHAPSSKSPDPSEFLASPSPIETTGISQTIVPRGSKEKRHAPSSKSPDPSEFLASPSPIETTGISQTIVPRGSEEKRHAPSSKLPDPSEFLASPSPIETTSVSQTIVPKGSEEKRHISSSKLPDPSEFLALPSPVEATTLPRRIVPNRSGASNSKEPHTVCLAILIYACLPFP